MASLPSKLPTQDTLGPLPSARSGRAIARVDTTAIGEGAASLGQALAGVGAKLSQRATEEQDRNEEFEVQRRLIEFGAQEDKAYDESRGTVTGDGAGFAEGTWSRFAQGASGLVDQSRTEGLSERALARLDLRLLQRGRQLEGQARDEEMRHRDVFHTERVVGTLRGLQDRAVASPQRLTEYIDEGSRLIDASRLTPAARQRERERFRLDTTRAAIEQRAALATTIEEQQRILQDLRTLRQGEALPPAQPQTAPRVNLDTANREMGLSQQERSFYERHLTNLYGAGGIDQPGGERSTVLGTTVEINGRTYLLPTVFDGKQLEPGTPEFRAAVEAAGGPDAFPSYATREEADARYKKLHDYMERDTQGYQQSRTRSVPVQPVPGGRTPVGAAPRQGAVEGIVLHHTSGTTLDSALSQNRLARTGYNYYVDRDGQVYQFAPDDQRMNHVMPAGSRDRRPGAYPSLSSDNTIGIGVVAQNDGDITEAQRDTLRRLTGQLMGQHGVMSENVVGHGELQHTREESEGSTAREIREGRARLPGDGRTRVAQAGEGFTFSDNPAYPHLSVSERQTLLNNLRTRFRASTIPLLRQGLERIVNGEEPETDANGRSALDLARSTMTPLQIQRWDEQWTRARALRDATSQIFTMRPEDAAEYVANLPPAIRGPVSRRADRLLELYQADPARAVAGGDLAGTDRRPPVSIDPTTGEPSVVSITGNEDIRLPAHPAVRAAYDQIRFNAAQRSQGIPERVSFGTDEDGEIVITEPAGEQRRLNQEEWRVLIEGRLAAQRALGIPEYQQAPITKSEAQSLLAMPQRMTDDQFPNAMRAAVDRAHERYGPYARMAIDTAIRYRANMPGQQAYDAASMARRLVSGETLTREDMERFDRRMKLDREQAAWLGSDRNYPSQEFQVLGFEPRMVAPPPVPRQPEQPRGWFGGTNPPPASGPGWGVEPRMTVGGLAAEPALRQGASAAASRRGSAAAPTSREESRGPGLSFSLPPWPQPTPQDVSDLQKYPDLQQTFDQRFGPGAAAAVLQGQAPGR